MITITQFWKKGQKSAKMRKIDDFSDFSIFPFYLHFYIVIYKKVLVTEKWSKDFDLFKIKKIDFPDRPNFF